MRKVRVMLAFMLNWAGPVIVLRPALPHSPDGLLYARAFRKCPSGAPS